MLFELTALCGCGSPESFVDDVLLLRDFNPGVANGDPFRLKIINNIVYFNATDDVNGGELWKSDGTTAGTVFVKDVFPGATGSGVDNITGANGLIFFTAQDSVDNIELWVSDGTTAGTMQVKDINPSGSSNPLPLINVNDTLFFFANDGVSGRELWKSDGTTAGTVMIKDINPGPGQSSMTGLGGAKSFNGEFYFSATRARLLAVVKKQHDKLADVDDKWRLLVFESFHPEMVKDAEVVLKRLPTELTKAKKSLEARSREQQRLESAGDLENKLPVVKNEIERLDAAMVKLQNHRKTSSRFSTSSTLCKLKKTEAIQIFYCARYKSTKI